MADNRLTEIVKKTRAYLASPEGQRRMKENRLAHGMSYQAALCAAIQTANRIRVIRYDDLTAIIGALALEEQAVAA